MSELTVLFFKQFIESMAQFHFCRGAKGIINHAVKFHIQQK